MIAPVRSASSLLLRMDDPKVAAVRALQEVNALVEAGAHRRMLEGKLDPRHPVYQLAEHLQMVERFERLRTAPPRVRTAVEASRVEGVPMLYGPDGQPL